MSYNIVLILALTVDIFNNIIKSEVPNVRYSNNFRGY
jgi:hypothetical protein